MIGIVPLAVDSIRSDSLGRVLRLEQTQEYMLFDFSVDSGGSYLSHTTYPEVDPVYVKKHLEVTVPAGHFTNCVELYFKRSFDDESVGYVFAPGVGIVKWYGPFYAATVLLGAIVDGRVISSATQLPAEVPSEFNLEQNYPNPFNPSTTIRYGLAQKSHVLLTVFNTLGQLVGLLVQGDQEAGYHEVHFDASGLSSGVYFYRLQAGDFVQTRKLLVIR